MSNDLHIGPHVTIPRSELKFFFTRSQGPGGQNVNKLSTRVELHFDVSRSSNLSETQKRRVLTALKSRIDADGVLHLSAQDSRSQWQNRVAVVDRFVELMRTALRPVRKRIATKPGANAKATRRVLKKLQSEKKRGRGRVGRED